MLRSDRSGDSHVPTVILFLVIGLIGEGVYKEVGEGGVGGADGGSGR